MSLTENSTLFLEYGDIIKIFASSNKELHQQTFFIKYIDNLKIQLLNVSTLYPYTLYYKEGQEGKLRDESVEEIHIIWKSTKKGYALQNKLEPHKWINIQFKDELYMSVSGEITDLEDDQIEVTIYPSLEIIYIDFEFKGLSENIEKITFISKPKYVDEKRKPTTEVLNDERDNDEDNTEKQNAKMTFSDNNESIIEIPESYKVDLNVRDNLRKLYVNANEIIFDDGEIEVVNQIVEIDEKKKIYSLDEQITSLLDELLSTIPNNARTKHVMDNIQRIIKNFKYLRMNFSKTDPYGNIKSPLILGKMHKPLVEKIQSLSSNLKWLIPVVSLKKTLYEFSKEDENDDQFEEIEDFTVDLSDNLREIQNIQNNYYKNGGVGQGGGAVAKYPHMIKSLEKTTNPFSATAAAEASVIHSSNVNENLEAIIDNIEEFKTIVCKNSKINSQRFVVQRFLKGVSLNWIEGKKMNHTQLTPNELVQIKSWLMLPEQIVRFSKIDLPATNILSRSLFSQRYPMYYRLFNKLENKIDRIKLDANDKELNYEQIEKETNISFLSSFKDFSIEWTEEGGAAAHKTYDSFLKKIIPNTFDLVALLQKYVYLNEQPGFSFIGMVKMLEPFFVYPKNITYGVYSRIRYFIKQLMIEWKNQQSLKSRECRLIRDKIWDLDNEYKNPLIVIFKENPELQNYYYGTYGSVFNKFMKKTASATEPGSLFDFTVQDNRLKSGELLQNILLIDNAKSLATLLRTNAFSLTIPDEIIEQFNIEKDKEDKDINMDEMEKIKPSSCSRKVLTKKYKSLKELQNDNHKDIYYDGEFDKTPYELLSKELKNKKEKMTKDKFLEYFAEVLVQKSSVPRSLSFELATAIIAGKKLVNDGEYALLEIYPEYQRNAEHDGDGDGGDDKDGMKNQYLERTFYIRKKNVWKKDDTIENLDIFMDNNTLICNINKDKCVKRSKTAVCQDNEEVRRDILSQTKSGLFKEFEIRVKESIKTTKTQLENEIKQNISFCKKNILISYLQLYKYNKYAFDLGTIFQRNNEGEDEGDIHTHHSRWESLMEKILSQQDFVKKQKDILAFAEQFTREPLVETLKESPYWFYCRESNVKLLPTYIYELAKAFVTGGSEEYLYKLKEIVRKYGTLSEDGDHIVDKLGGSGRIITMIDFVEEEEFDEAGFRIKKNEIGKDTAEIVEEAIALDLPTGQKKKKERFFENDTNESIYNVFLTICNNMDIDEEEIEDIVMRVSSETANKIILNEAQYLKKMKKLEKMQNPQKPQSEISYSHYKNQNIILIVAFVTFVAIQTSAPPFHPKNTVPGCVFSFSGYPFGEGGEENTDGLKYLACVLNISKSSIGVWSSIKGIKEATFIKTMKDIISKHVIERLDILERVKTRADYLLTHPDALLSNIPKEHSIKKWKHFLPPIVKYRLSQKLSGNPLPTNFFQEFKKSLIHANDIQWSEIGLIKVKLIEYAFAIIEKINDVVKRNEPILNTVTRIPYLQNACCNDKNASNILNYFKEKEPEIAKYVEIAKKIAESLELNDILSLAPIFIHTIDTTRKTTIIPTTGHSVENIYQSFIYYCKFDNDAPIPENLRNLVATKPPHGYNPQWSILEKIEFLKENGKIYNVSDLDNLMVLINGQNKVVEHAATTDETQPSIVTIPNTQRMEEYIGHLDYIDNNIIDSPLKKHLLAVLSKNHSKTMVVKEAMRDEMSVLKNHLIFSNSKMKESIFQFMDEFRGKIEKKKIENAKHFINDFIVWEDDNDERISTVVQFTKNTVHELTVVFPTMIKTNKSLLKTIPLHWDLSNFHHNDVEKFIENHYSPILQFLGNETVCSLLEQTEDNLRPLIDFSNYIPVIQPLKKWLLQENTGEKKEHTFYSVFDKDTIYLLFQYVFYSILYEYVQKSNDPEMTRINAVNVRNQRKNDKNEEETDIHGIDNVQTEEEKDENQRLIEIQLMVGNHESIKKKTVELLIAFLSIIEETKKSFNKSYTTVTERVIRSKLEEKKTITDYFKNMTNDERKVENTLKIMKMGRWNIGMQKGVFKYDKDVYDKEHLDIVNVLDKTNEINDYVIHPEKITKNIEDLENEIKEIENEEYENEEYGIDHLDEDYMDGDYYGEDDD